MSVIFTADDFGITPEQSRRILECSSMAPGGKGLLSSVSVLATSPRFEECAPLLDACSDELRISVHLNFVEGPCAANPEDLPLLVDEKGFFKLGYGGLLAASVGPRSAELERELTLEAKAQAARIVARFPRAARHLCLDGHQHTQLIPAVFRAMLATAADPAYSLEYLRIPVETAGPARAAGVAASVKPVNWVKHALLGTLWSRDRRMLEASGLGPYEDRSAVFSGVLFSGQMDKARVSAVLPGLAEEAQRRGMGLELLFHPGRVDAPEHCLNPSLPGFVEFSCGEGRDIEHEALRSAELAAAFGALRDEHGAVA